jgi:hypothetical protein
MDPTACQNPAAGFEPTSRLEYSGRLVCDSVTCVNHTVLWPNELQVDRSQIFTALIVCLFVETQVNKPTNKRQNKQSSEGSQRRISHSLPSPMSDAELDF